MYVCCRPKCLLVYLLVGCLIVVCSVCRFLRLTAWLVVDVFLIWFVRWCFRLLTHRCIVHPCQDVSVCVCWCGWLLVCSFVGFGVFGLWACLFVCWFIGLLVTVVVGLFDRRLACLFVCLVVGLRGCWFMGLLILCCLVYCCWFVPVGCLLIYWFAGSFVYCFVWLIGFVCWCDRALVLFA